MLWQYWDEEVSFRAAFLRWADDLTSGYDKYRSGLDSGRSHVPPIDLSVDPAAVAAARAQRFGAVPALRKLLKPLWGNGTTIRHIADLTGMELHQAVVVLVSAAHGRKWRDYIAMEDELLDRGRPSTWKEMNERYGFWDTSQVAQKMAKRHGIYA